MGAYAKNTLRTIWGNKRRSLMLMLITAMGAAFFIGLRSASPDMNATFSSYYHRQNMFDVQVISSYGLTDSYIDRLRAVDGVKRVEGVYHTDLFAKLGDASYLFRFHSYEPNGADHPMAASPLILSGKMPERTGECAVSARFADMSGCTVGDVLSLSTGDDTLLSHFVSRETYVITGLVLSPLYIRDDLGTSKKGSGSLQAYAYIPLQDFSLDVYSEAQVFLSNPHAYSRFDERFAAMSAEVEKDLQQVGDEIAAHRRRVLTDRAIREISQATAKLDAAHEALTQAQRDFDASELAFQESEQALLRQRAALYEQVLSGRHTIASGNAELLAARRQAEQGNRALAAGRAALENARLRNDYPIPWIRAAEADLDEQAKELARAETELAGQEAMLLAGADALDAALYGGLVQLAGAQAEVSAARDVLDDGRARFLAEKAAVSEQSTTAQHNLAAARRSLRAMPQAKCFVLGLDQNANFESFRQDSDRINSISQVFPLFFFLVAALVAFTCMVRIVEDDRSTAAVLQSLGYGSGKVFWKYISYALCVGIPGTILGIAVGHRLFPTVIFDYGYRIMYLLPSVETPLYPALCVKVFFISLISVLFPALQVSAANLMQIPAELMRPKAPPPGKRIFLESLPALWSRLNFSAKVTARNILRYKKRFFMTVAGISGCTAILLTGFGLRDSIRSVAQKQFDDVFFFDFAITVTDNHADRTALERFLQSSAQVSDWQYQYRENIDVRLGAKGISYSTTLVVPEDAKLFPDFVKLADPRSSAPVSLSDYSVVITQKLASLLHVGAGDEITLIDEDDAQWIVPIRGVTQNYVAHYIYMTPRHYAAITGSTPDFNTIIGTSPGLMTESRNAFSELLLDYDGVVTLTFNAKTRDFYQDLLDALNIVVFVLIVCGALLSFIVLFCLTGINIDERKREIATIKVLGFYDKEASSYIFRENIINTVVGALAGIGLGALLHQYIIRTVELDMIIFGKVVQPMSYTYAVALTFLFTFAVNASMSGDIHHVDMIESLKSVE